jgi:hypothetical protein
MLAHEIPSHEAGQAWRKAMRALSVSVAGALALALGACTPDFVEQSQANVIVRITKITGDQGGGGGDSGIGDVLNSDVDPVFNDNATLNFESVPKNPRGLTLGQFNDVFLERYEVLYLRSDGRNQEGVDVPFRITGPLATLVPAGGTAAASIIIVRHQAKIEPPLRNLRGVFPASGTLQTGGAGILSIVAEITVHGRTTSGEAVQASGRLQINFADFADTQ